MNSVMHIARKAFLETVMRNRKGEAKGIYAVCTANTEVLEACLQQAKEDSSIILIEATSNQVNQFGGYTGMKPADFAHHITQIAGKIDFPVEMILLGGDHLGPNAWQHLKAAEAMKKAQELIEEYVKAGFEKIHLDTSMFCADDEGDRTKPLTDEVVAERAAILCKVAEKAWAKYRPNTAPPLYIIGTEVPVPGGATEEEQAVAPTLPQDAERTISITEGIFKKYGLQDAWQRVVGVVVQPGVEFGDDFVFNYQPDKARELSHNILSFDHIVYEAHSTDYQTEAGLHSLVKDHFCILKVGPWLTFAYREALFALEVMERELLGKDHPDLSNLQQVMEEVMKAKPDYWKKYYHGTEQQQRLKRKYSFSDRLRYYWPAEQLNASRKKLFHNLSKIEIPLSLLSQFMPVQFRRVCEGLIAATPEDIVSDHIREVTSIYSRACGLSNKEKTFKQ